MKCPVAGIRDEIDQESGIEYTGVHDGQSAQDEGDTRPTERLSVQSDQGQYVAGSSNQK